MSRIAKAAALTLAASAALTGAAGVASANSDADGVAVGSPGIVSGNTIQVPIQLPINLCGNTIDIIALLNPTFGNQCVNADVEEHEHFHGHHGHGDHDHDRW
ncbi:chaplin [Streptomyces sp. NPDC002537]